MKVLNLFKILLAFATAALIVGTGTVAGLFWHFSHGLPDHKQLADYQPAISSRLYAADGRLLAEYAREKRVFVPVAAMPKRVLEAFVAAEDQRFFSHPGVDFIGVVRAVIANVANPGKRPEGASGLTQQVAKNFLLSNQATLARKIREAILAFRIEETYSKERILELYLNEIYLGSGNYGVAQAAHQLLRPVARRADAVGDRLSRGAAQGAQPLQSHPQREGSLRPPRLRAGPHARRRLHHPGRDAAGQGREAAIPSPRQHRGGAGRLLRRGSAPQPDGGLWREGPLRRRPHRLDHARSGHPGGRRQRPARWPDHLRPPPRLARPVRQDPRHERVGGGVRPHRPAPAAGRPGELAARRGQQDRAAGRADRRPALKRRRGRRGHRAVRRDDLGRADLGRAAARRAAAAAPGRRQCRRRDRGREGREAGRQGRQALSAQDLRAAPGAQRRGRRGGDGHPDRPRARHVGRLVLRPQPVQPRRPGGAPAGLVVQAVRLSRGHGFGLHAGLDRARRAVLLRPGLRPAGLDAQELRRRLPRPDHGAARPRECRATS